MLIETGVVVRADANSVWIKTLRKTTCGSCRARQGCGQSLLQSLVSVDADIRARIDHDAFGRRPIPGDEVEIAIEEGAVIAASFLAYGLPLIFLILGVVLAESMAVGDLVQLLAGMVGLTIGLSFSRLVFFSHFKPSYFEPRVMRSLGPPSLVTNSN